MDGIFPGPKFTCKTEVPQNKMPIVVYEQVLRFDVSMNDSLCVYVFKGYELGSEVRRMSKTTINNDRDRTSSAM